MLRYPASVILALFFLVGCRPTTPDTSHSSPSMWGAGHLQGVWLKKSVAEKFRAQSAPECGTLITTSPTAFKVEHDGTVKLLLQGSLGDALTLGHINAEGAIKNPGLFERLDLDYDVLRVHNAFEQKTVEYVRSSRGEVEQAIAQSEDCLTGLLQEPTTASGLENRAVLAKNKIQLAAQKMAGFDSGDLALGILLAGNTALFAREAYKVSLAQTVSTMNKSELTSRLHATQETLGTSLKNIQNQFEQLQSAMAARLPQGARWSHLPSVDHRSLEERITRFNGHFDRLVPVDNSSTFTALEQGVDGKMYGVVPGGKIEFSPNESALLSSLRSEYREIHDKMQIDVIKLDKKLKSVEQPVKQAQFRRNAVGAVLAVLAVAETVHVWYKLHSAAQMTARNEKVARLIELSDDELREKIRGNPKLAALLIETEKNLKQD